MSPLGPADFIALLDLLKSKGVRLYRQGDLHIEFGGGASVEDLEAAPADTSEFCRCGHGVYEHTQGVCLHCPPEKCVEVPK